MTTVTTIMTILTKKFNNDNIDKNDKDEWRVPRAFIIKSKRKPHQLDHQGQNTTSRIRRIRPRTPGEAQATRRRRALTPPPTRNTIHRNHQ